MTIKHCIEKTPIICPQCKEHIFIKMNNELICKNCYIVVNAPYPYVAGNKINVNYTIEPVKPRYTPSPVRQKQSNPVYRHSLTDKEIVQYNRKPKLIKY